MANKNVRLSLLLPVLIYLILVLFMVRSTIGTGKKITFSKIKVLLNTTDVLEVNLTFATEGRVVKLNGELKQLLDLDNNWKLQFSIFHADSMKKVYERILMPVAGVCDFMQTYYKKFFYGTVRIYTDAPDPATCPVKKDTYVIKSYPLDMIKLKQHLPYGEYQLWITLFQEREAVLRLAIYCRVDSEI